MRYHAMFGLLLALSLALLGGCATVQQSPAEVKNRLRQSVDMDMRQLADDWNYLWLQQRQSRFTRWHTR